MKRGWIIKSGLLVIAFTFALLQFNCELVEEKVVVETVEPEIVIPDSTAYFDSVYAPIAYKLDTFFEKKFKATTFNGTVLFAERGRIIFEKELWICRLEKERFINNREHFQSSFSFKAIYCCCYTAISRTRKDQLDRSVEKYIPSFPYTGIDIHQLLSHRSGLSKYDHFCDQPDSIWPDKHKSIHNADVIDIMASNHTTSSLFAKYTSLL